MFKLQAATLGRLNGLAEEMIGGQRIVTAFNYQERAFDQFNALNQELYGIGVKAQFYSSLPNPTTRFVNNITYIAVGIIGCFAAILRVITVGDISSFLIYANVFAKPFNEISGVIAQFQSALASAGRVFELIDTPKQTPDPCDAVELAEARGMVTFKHVNFAYQKNRPLIQDFNLAVKPGCRIAIVGATGAGKTTIVNLLMRFYDVDSGSIQVDGIATDKISRDSLRRSFGMVLQDTWLFSGTVRENIAYGRPEATDEEIEAAAKAASAHSFIRRLPEGYNTRISSTGDNFSQGEIQLLTIARVMLAQPPMLILDEATSNIDVITEMKIQKAFLAMMAGRTSFVIAHRLSTIKEADLILVMENGNIIESGSHAELLAQQGAYYRLYNSQFAPNQ
jgi:ATP-binding cassette subfamily B protein